MAVTILEKLRWLKLLGARKRNESLEPVYEFVHEHLIEIEEAYERGYSWGQIEEACVEVYRKDGKRYPINWWKSHKLIEYSYRQVKRHSTTD